MDALNQSGYKKDDADKRSFLKPTTLETESYAHKLSVLRHNQQLR